MFTENLKEIISAIGYLGLFGIVFAESGILFGFIFPGDSLLVTTGLLASQGLFRIEFLIPLLAIAAVAGDSAGYWMGKKFGPRIFNKEKSFFFDKKHIERANAFYKKYGKKTLIIARFLPYIRPFAPIMAGVGNMEYGKFISYNVIGGILWTAGMLGFGYFLGNTIPNVDKYLIPIILIIIFLSLLPTVIENRIIIKHQIKKALARIFPQNS